jgi:tripartite-type tricarboxylate transporter receptor subunit TctC
MSWSRRAPNLGWAHRRRHGRRGEIVTQPRPPSCRQCSRAPLRGVPKAALTYRRGPGVGWETPGAANHALDGDLGAHRMKPSRRKFLGLGAGAAVLPALPCVVRAQTYPSRPVRLISGFPAGGVNDLLARLIGQWLTERLGQQVIVENRPGAAGNIATEAAVRAAADGYTLLMLTVTHAINATLYEKLNYDLVRDIAPVASLIRSPLVMEVTAAFPAKTVPEFIAYAKANPGKINMASSGNGTPPHVAGELFKMLTGIDMVHVPYRGGAPALTDLIGGQVQVMFAVLPEVIEQIKAGKVRALAVTTAVRADALPDVPTVGDFVAGFEASYWGGIGAPRTTPAEIIDRLNTEINLALADHAIKARLLELGDARGVREAHRRRDRKMGEGGEVCRRPTRMKAISCSAAAEIRCSRSTPIPSCSAPPTTTPMVSRFSLFCGSPVWRSGTSTFSTRRQRRADSCLISSMTVRRSATAIRSSPTSFASTGCGSTTR